MNPSANNNPRRIIQQILDDFNALAALEGTQGALNALLFGLQPHFSDEISYAEHVHGAINSGILANVGYELAPYMDVLRKSHQTAVFDIPTTPNKQTLYTQQSNEPPTNLIDFTPKKATPTPVRNVVADFSKTELSTPYTPSPVGGLTRNGAVVTTRTGAIAWPTIPPIKSVETPYSPAKSSGITAAGLSREMAAKITRDKSAASPSPSKKARYM